MDFNELTMQFLEKGQQYRFQGLTSGSLDIISSHRMENILKKGHSGIISQLHSIQEVETPSMHPDLQSIISKHQFFFPLLRDSPLHVHDHCVPLVPDSIPTNVLPYCHPCSQKNEIEKIMQELIQEGVILPSTSPYSYHVVMVLKKEGTWCMCPDFHSLNKLTIKYKFPILVIDDLFDEFCGAQYFTKLDIHSGYHEICMK
jgi:hypothetical protein